jgi:hypothetical protein
MKEQELPAEIDDLRAVLRRRERARKSPTSRPLHAALATTEALADADSALESEGEVLNAYQYAPVDGAWTGEPPPPDDRGSG